MPFIQAFCPKCNKELSVPDDLDNIICNYCGESFRLRKPNKEDLKDVDAELETEKAFNLIDNEKLTAARPDDEVFNRNSYEPSFNEYYELLKMSLEHLYLAADVIDDDTQINALFKRFAEHLVTLIDNNLKKSKSIDPTILYTRHMISFVIPSILRDESSYSQILSDHIIDIWNDKHPKNLIRETYFEQINAGFKSRPKWCYITTAVCGSMNKPDDCAELTSFRWFRDNWLIKQDFGMSAIYDYYHTAPSIVKAIDSQANHSGEYRRIWSDYLSACFDMIANGNYADCYNKYKAMVEHLKQKWL